MIKIEEFRELKKCNICNSAAYKVIYSWNSEHYSHDKFDTASWDGRQCIELQIVKCNNCGLIYSNPAFKEEYLDLVYPKNVLSNHKAFNLSALNSDKWKDILQLVSVYLDKEDKIMDIGTKFGVLVKQLQDKGYNALGLEYNKTSVEIAKEQLGIRLINGGIPELKKHNLGRINAFILDDVLEHLTNPMRDIEILSHFQKKGDFLFLKQMNWDCLARKIYKKNWYYLQPAAHTYYFNEKSIRNLLEKNNYRIIKIKQTGIYRNLLRLLSNIVKPPKLSKDYLTTRRGLNDMFLVIARKKQ